MNQIDVLNHALQIIDASEYFRMTPYALAQHLGYSRSRLDSLFSKMVGESLGKFILRQRLDWAADELAMRQRRIIDIALDAGFDSHEAFTRAFQRRYSCSPVAYRRIGQPRVLRSKLIVQPHARWVGRTQLTMIWYPRSNHNIRS